MLKKKNPKTSKLDLSKLYCQMDDDWMNRLLKVFKDLKKERKSKMEQLEDSTQYIYIITRRDLPLPQQFVQAGHAIWQSSQANRDLADHPHFCLCAVKDENRLKHDFNKLQEKNIKLYPFYESDLDNQLTAFATGPISGADRWHFRNFQLLKGEQK